jgi:hypothetical protein
MTLLLLLLLFLLQNLSPLSAVTSPFANSSSKIENISKSTPDAKYDVSLKYSQDAFAKGEPSFFMVNMFSNDDGGNTRLRHVDCDFVILRDENELFRLSKQYGEPLFHSINGVILASFHFVEAGNYTISIEIAGEYFIPITPVFANFSGVVTRSSDGNLRINLA